MSGATTCAPTFQRSSVKDSNMPYTEFSKSYGDFEVVIPAVDFSAMSRIDALCAVQTLRQYEYGNVYRHLERWGLENADKCIDEMLTKHTGDRFSSLNVLIVRQFKHDKNMPSFDARYQSGITLRKEWCEHMAKEIEREFGFTNW